MKQNVPEHAQGWLGSKWLWLFVVAVMYVIFKLPGVGEKSKVRVTPHRFLQRICVRVPNLGLGETGVLILTGRTVAYTESGRQGPTSCVVLGNAGASPGKGKSPTSAEGWD